MFELSFHEDRCTDCGACELACSYHFTRAFNPRKSAIQVRRFFDLGEIKIKFHKVPAAERNSCDLCAGEPTPLCAKYCATEAIEVKGTA